MGDSEEQRKVTPAEEAELKKKVFRAVVQGDTDFDTASTVELPEEEVEDEEEEDEEEEEEQEEEAVEFVMIDLQTGLVLDLEQDEEEGVEFVMIDLQTGGIL